jgi:hypothetical protein
VHLGIPRNHAGVEGIAGDARRKTAQRHGRKLMKSENDFLDRSLNEGVVVYRKLNRSLPKRKL